MIIASLKSYTQATLTYYLQQIFANNSDYTWSIHYPDTEIEILGEFPKRAVKYPCIIVGDVTGEILRTIGSSYIGATFGDRAVGLSQTIINGICNIKYGGGFNITVNLHIAGQSTVERREIYDTVIIYLRYVLPPLLEPLGIHLRTIHMGAGRSEPLNNQYIYMSSVNLDYYVEFSDQLYNQDIIGKIKAQLQAVNDGISGAFFSSDISETFM